MQRQETMNKNTYRFRGPPVKIVHEKLYFRNASNLRSEYISPQRWFMTMRNVKSIEALSSNSMLLNKLRCCIQNISRCINIWTYSIFKREQEFMTIQALMVLFAANVEPLSIVALVLPHKVSVCQTLIWKISIQRIKE